VTALSIPLFAFFTVITVLLLATGLRRLMGMIFLVISEALVPSGSLPGPLYALRGTRRLAGRTRRYSQISALLGSQPAMTATSVRPPSTSRTAPWTKAASSEAR